eukprot:scpid63250/ scgid5568/ 
MSCVCLAMEKTDNTLDKECSEGPNVVQKSTILVVCKGTVGDVLPVLRLLIACRSNDDVIAAGTGAGCRLLPWQLNVMCHPDVMVQVRTLLGCHGDQLTWLPYQHTAVEVSKLREDDEGRQRVLNTEFAHCLEWCRGQQPHLIVFNLFSLDAWLIAQHFSIPTLAVSPYLPVEHMPCEVEAAINADYPLFLSGLREAPQGCIGYEDVRFWLWRCMLSDFGDCCTDHDIDPCPLVTAFTSPCTTPTGCDADAHDDDDGLDEPRAKRPLPSPASSPLSSSVHGPLPDRRFLRATPLLVTAPRFMIPSGLQFPSSTHIVECGHAMHCRNRTLAEQQELATSTACVEQGGRDQLPVSLQSFIDSCSVPPVYCGFGAMDALNVLTVREWKKFLSVLLQVLAERHGHPLILQTIPNSNLHTALCQIMLTSITSSVMSSPQVHTSSHVHTSSGGDGWKPTVSSSASPMTSSHQREQSATTQSLLSCDLHPEPAMMSSVMSPDGASCGKSTPAAVRTRTDTCSSGGAAGVSTQKNSCNSPTMMSSVSHTTGAGCVSPAITSSTTRVSSGSECSPAITSSLTDGSNIRERGTCRRDSGLHTRAAADAGQSGRSSCAGSDSDDSVPTVRQYIGKCLYVVTDVLDHVPLFSQCGLIVHHAGIGTVHTLLRSRQHTRQLLFPVMFDQERNARAIVNTLELRRQQQQQRQQQCPKQQQRQQQ